MLVALLSLVPTFCPVPTPLQDPGRQFGRSVATLDANGDGFADVLVGEPHYSGTLAGQGRALLYLGSPAGPVGQPAWVHDGPQAGAHFGATLANAGDMNGDGREDAVIGLPEYDGGRRRLVAGPGAAASIPSRQDAGLVAFFLGTPAGLTNAETGSWIGGETDERLGVAVAGAGDVNGDGLSDVVAGASGARGGRGAAYLFLGSASSASVTPASILRGPVGTTSFGTAVGGGADADGDGLDDVVVGAPDGGTNGGGAAYLHRGSAVGLELAPWWSRSTLGPESDFGAAVTVADVTADGFVDVLVGDPLTWYSAGHVTTPRVGSLDIYSGSASGPEFSTRLVFDILTANAGYGQAISTAGDLNGDGVLECAPAAPSSGFGRVAVPELFFPGVPIFAYNTVLSGTQVGEGFGLALAIGDVDANGFDDVVVGAPRFDAASADAGRVWVISGSTTFFSAPPPQVWTLIAP